MIKWLMLLVVIGLAVSGWHYRDQVSHWLPSLSPKAIVSSMSGGTPHPATESRAHAVKAYPALGVQGSQFNIKFVQMYNQVKETDPGFLAQADWPMLLAQRAAQELGMSALPTPLPPPTHASNSVLNEHPGGPAGTIRPSVPLRGIQGSSLDQRPASYYKNKGTPAPY